MTKKFQTSDTPTPYKLTCPKHGVMYLTEEAFNAQLLAGSQPWLCPCGRASEFTEVFASGVESSRPKKETSHD